MTPNQPEHAQITMRGKNIVAGKSGLGENSIPTHYYRRSILRKTMVRRITVIKLWLNTGYTVSYPKTRYAPNLTSAPLVTNLYAGKDIKRSSHTLENQKKEIIRQRLLSPI